MSNVHYFQRYNQKENWITNSTLLLFSRLYNHSLYKFQEFIDILLSDANSEANFEASFKEQSKGNNSVPDAMILQNSIQIIIETKLHDNYSNDQLIRHLSAFEKNINQKILIGLSKREVKATTTENVYKVIKGNKDYSGIKFVSITYKKVYESFIKAISATDYEMHEIADDYLSLCQEEQLIDSSEEYMLAVTSGTSLKENLKYGIYYDPVTRNNNLGFKYLALYDNKKIVALGELKKTVICDYVDGKLELLNDDARNMTLEEKNRVSEIIKVTDYYDITKGTKFYLVDKFFPTDFQKISYQAMRNKRYFDLSEAIDLTNNDNAESIAEKLRGKTWE